MLTPVALWGLEVPPNGTPVLVGEDVPLSVQITMAAIDPTAEAVDKKKPQLATLRLLRRRLDESDFDDDSEEDSDEEEEEDSEEEEDEKKKADAKLKKIAKNVAKATSEKMDVDGDSEGDEDDSDEEDDEDFMGTLEELVVCTLDATKTYQQPLNLHISDKEIVFFKNTGNYTVYLTGNYVDNDDEDSESGSDSEDDYDLSPDEDDLIAPYDSDEESDDLDDLADPRITEVDSEDEKKEAAKKEKADKKAAPVAGKKRAAEESDAEKSPKKTTDDLAKEEPKLSKKQQKKLKANDGKAAEAPATATSTKDGKKVKFAAQLEQGPTPSKSEKEKSKPEAKSPATPSGARKVQGITIEDKTIGSGPAAKAGSKLKMRYVGKLLNGKQFDSNTSGKPFSFVLGKGQVIKGWDVGLIGIQAGGERKLVIPPESAYGKKGMPGIPANSTLVFEVKALAVN